jgi:Asp-tRNA(Asn)/Glu-tRNA(Gln) amidotransferase A subunit family amidase/Asp-tRNA(Asn)/Glu-tRNA(Gln) amidotransferase C subunit
MPGVLWAHSEGNPENITLEMIDQAARLAGLEFTSEEREAMLPTLQGNLELFRELREMPMDQNLAPPLHFSPVVPGQRLEEERRPFRPTPPPDVQRPSDLEDVAFWPVTHLGALIFRRQVTSVELTQMYLDRLRRFDPILECVVTFTDALAMEEAERADQELAAGRYRGPLHGIPWGAKDILAKRGYPTTWGSEAYREQVLDYDATVVQRLREAGAVLVAKLATGEMARGDRWFGGRRTRNPWNPAQGSGGSSAGPGAATAAGLVGFSIGTETLGSILGPSRTCGITGLRPTFGVVSRHGVMPMSWSLDKVGPMCRSVEDCALVLEAIRGPDLLDLAVADRPFNWDAGLPLSGLRVGYLEEAFDAEPRGPNGGAARANDLATLEVLRGMGVELRPFTLPDDAGMDALQTLLVDEAAAFDELIQTGRVDLLIQDREDPEGMLMRVARLFPAVEYLQMHRRRALLMRRMAEAMGDLHVYVAPHGGSPNTSANNLTGHPGVSVPNGFAPDGTPTGIQFIGRLYGEAETLRLAKAFQDATGFHLRTPPLAPR